MRDADGELLVIGAGPAGLALGHALQRRGVPFRILEGGAAPGDSWQRMPLRMTMNSPWGVNALPGTRVGALAWGRRLSRAEYAAYLVSYARERALPLALGERVDRVERTPDGRFLLHTAAGPREAARIANATGYFSAPVVPELPGAARSRLVQVTAASYGDPDSLAARIAGGGRRIVIVGKRITAGQLALELHDAGFAVALSARSAIEFAYGPALQRLGWRVFYPTERWRLAHSPAFAARSSALPMAGGRARRLLARGAIRTLGPLARIGDDHVELASGACEPCDAILWATGFRPALAHLAGLVPLDPATGLPRLAGPASLDAPGLYFLGLDGQTDYTSRMLRGIHRDALALAAQLASGRA